MVVANFFPLYTSNNIFNFFFELSVQTRFIVIVLLQFLFFLLSDNALPNITVVALFSFVDFSFTNLIVIVLNILNIVSLEYFKICSLSGGCLL